MDILLSNHFSVAPLSHMRALQFLSGTSTSEQPYLWIHLWIHEFLLSKAYSLKVNYWVNCWAHFKYFCVYESKLAFGKFILISNLSPMNKIPFHSNISQYWILIFLVIAQSISWPRLNLPFCLLLRWNFYCL